MAKRAIKGVLARNDWQFFESACSIAVGAATMPSPAGGFLFQNNSTVGDVLDIYRVDVAIASASFLEYGLFQNLMSYTPISGQSIFIYPMNLTPGQPTGLLAAYSAATRGGTLLLRARYDNPTSDSIELKTGGPFLSLPPGWGFVAVISPSGNTNMSITIWYQVMSDQIVPAS